jgi:hypothetical protein
MLWIYGSIATITFFVSCLGVWYGIQRRKARLLQTHGAGREDYEFEMLPNGGEEIRAGELYDAFAGDEEFQGKNEEEGRKSMDDGDMGGFLADSDEDEGDEKSRRRLLRDQSLR